MERVPVSSSNIVAIGYDPDSQTLEIEFKGGALYQYFSVPQSEYESLLNASSIGSYFHANIKNRYQFSKV
jgi:hypothetical protein